MGCGFWKIHCCFSYNILNYYWSIDQLIDFHFTKMHHFCTNALCKYMFRVILCGCSSMEKNKKGYSNICVNISGKSSAIIIFYLWWQNLFYPGTFIGIKFIHIHMKNVIKHYTDELDWFYLLQYWAQPNTSQVGYGHFNILRGSLFFYQRI